MTEDQNQQTFMVTIRSVDYRTHEGIPDLLIEAWVRGSGCTDLIAVGTTDAAGEVILEISENTLHQMVGPRSAVAFFRVFEGERLLIDTEGSLVWRIRDAHPMTLCIPVDLEIPEGTGTPARWILRGALLDAGGRPLYGARIAAFDRNVGKPESLLGDVSTDASGRFRIEYTRAQLGRPGKMRADLAVRAHDAGGTEIATRFICGAPPTAVVDLMAAGEPSGPSEVEQLTAALLPAMGEIPILELSDEDIELASCSARVDHEHLTWLVTA